MRRQTFVAFLLTVFFLCHCSATSYKRSVGEVVDDNVIHVKLDTKFMKDKVVEAKDVNIKVWKGVVTLTGAVDNQNQIDRAIEIAEQQKGVVEVKAYLTLKNMGANDYQTADLSNTGEGRPKKGVFSVFKKLTKGKGATEAETHSSKKIVEEDIIEPKSASNVDPEAKNADYSEFGTGHP